MADIRKAFGAFVVQNWARLLFDDEVAAHSYGYPGPGFDWPETHARVLILCWKRFREYVVHAGQNGGRTDLVPAAEWVRDVCRIIRAPDNTAVPLSPATMVWVEALGSINACGWLSEFASELCKRRFLWTVGYWWDGAGPSDQAWATAYAKCYHPTFKPPPMPDTLDALAPDKPTDLHKFKDFVEGTGKFAPKPTAAHPAELIPLKRGAFYRHGHARASHHSNGVAMEKPLRRLAWVSYPTMVEDLALRDSVRLHLGSCRE